MHAELSVALNFIISHLYNKLPRRRVDVFREELQRGFELRFVGHWYPDCPSKGSGFRCVKLAADKVCRVTSPLCAANFRLLNNNNDRRLTTANRSRVSSPLGHKIFGPLRVRTWDREA